MGRGIEPGAEASRLQHGGQHGAHRTLAIGARHVDGEERLLRLVQLRQQGDSFLQPELHRMQVAAVQVGQGLLDAG